MSLSHVEYHEYWAMLISKETEESTRRTLPCQQCMLSPVPPSYSSLKMGLAAFRSIPARSLATPRKPRSLTPRRHGRGEGCVKSSSWLEVDRIPSSRRKNGFKSRSSGELARLSLLQCSGDGRCNAGLVKSSLKYSSSGELGKLSALSNNEIGPGAGVDLGETGGGATVRSVSCGDVAGLMGEKQLKHFLTPRNKQRTVDAVALHLRGSVCDVVLYLYNPVLNCPHCICEDPIPKLRNPLKSLYIIFNYQFIQMWSISDI